MSLGAMKQARKAHILPVMSLWLEIRLGYCIFYMNFVVYVHTYDIIEKYLLSGFI